MEAIRKHQTETLGQEATATITRGGARSVRDTGSGQDPCGDRRREVNGTVTTLTLTEKEEWEREANRASRK